MHKFGIELPKTAEEAYWLDDKSGTYYWRKSIYKEINKVYVVLNFKEEVKCSPVGHH